jgi:hypothetical protein
MDFVHDTLSTGDRFGFSLSSIAEAGNVSRGGSHFGCQGWRWARLSIGCCGKDDTPGPTLTRDHVALSLILT